MLSLFGGLSAVVSLSVPLISNKIIPLNGFREIVFRFSSLILCNNRLFMNIGRCHDCCCGRCCGSRTTKLRSHVKLGVLRTVFGTRLRRPKMCCIGFGYTHATTRGPHEGSTLADTHTHHPETRALDPPSHAQAHFAHRRQDRRSWTSPPSSICRTRAKP